MEMGLDVWKWQKPSPFSFPARVVGNDFQPDRGNQAFRHFQRPTITPPTWGAGLRQWPRPPPGRGATGTAAACTGSLRSIRTRGLRELSEEDQNRMRHQVMYSDSACGGTRERSF